MRIRSFLMVGALCLVGVRGQVGFGYEENLSSGSPCYELLGRDSVTIYSIPTRIIGRFEL